MPIKVSIIDWACIRQVLTLTEYVIYSWYILNNQLIDLNLSLLMYNKNKNRKFVAS